MNERTRSTGIVHTSAKARLTSAEIRIRIGYGYVLYMSTYMIIYSPWRR